MVAARNQRERKSFEYWAAMALMGRYAAANHACIHQHIAANLGATVLLDLENHHNFAWKEKHVIDGQEREVIVHRKGATPAGERVHSGTLYTSGPSSGQLMHQPVRRYIADDVGEWRWSSATRR